MSILTNVQPTICRKITGYCEPCISIMHIVKNHFIACGITDVNGHLNRAACAEIGNPDLGLRRQGFNAIKTNDGGAGAALLPDNADQFV
jgi:hypothetical protein